MNNTISVEQEVEAFKRRLLDERLAQLTEKQRDLFWRIWSYSEHPGVILNKDLTDCIDLCDRTIRKNLAGRAADPEHVPFTQPGTDR